MSWVVLVIIMEPAGQNSAHGVAMETQAIGRSVRLGQVRHVTVTRFVIEGTVEEKIHHLNMEARKQRGNSILQPSDINTITAEVEVSVHTFRWEHIAVCGRAYFEPHLANQRPSDNEHTCFVVLISTFKITCIANIWYSNSDSLIYSLDVSQTISGDQCFHTEPVIYMD